MPKTSAAAAAGAGQGEGERAARPAQRAARRPATLALGRPDQLAPQLGDVVAHLDPPIRWRRAVRPRLTRWRTTGSETCWWPAISA